MKPESGSYLLVKSGKCLFAEKYQCFNNLIPAENLRFCYDLDSHGLRTHTEINQNTQNLQSECSHLTLR
jgi:hypothetical protein